MLANSSKLMPPKGKDCIPTCTICSNMMPLNVQIVVCVSLPSLGPERGSLGTWNSNPLMMDVALCTSPLEHVHQHTEIEIK